MVKRNECYRYVNGQRKWIGPAYPNLGATVAKLRHGNDRRAHGAAVEEAIKVLQRRELLNSLAREIKRVAYAPPSVGRLGKYSRPNPFPMVGDPYEPCPRLPWEQRVQQIYESMLNR